MVKYLILYVLLFCITGFSCHRPDAAKQPENALAGYFKQKPVSEALRFEITGNSTIPEGDSIPNSLFFSQLETRLMNDIGYIDNSSELKVIARYRFPLTDNLEAYLVDMRQNWYQHQSLFLFDKQKNKFTERETVAEFYGGDGGQILTGSWLADYDKDGNKDLIRREIEHWIILNDDNTRDTTAESATLLLWKGDKFTGMASDTASLIKQFPINSLW
jgi:hypothetical protein